MSIPLKPPSKPNYLTKLIDFLNRTVRGQLHLPPWWLRDVGGADFEAVGQVFLAIFKQQANLQPHDLYNKRYNPTGHYLAEEYTFLFAEESFDFIFLTSVFTHMLPEGVKNYLEEIARLLRPDGRAFITFFLLNEKQQMLAAQGHNDIDFNYGSGPYRVRSEVVLESAVAYKEDFLRQLLPQCGLEISKPIHYGAWSGRVGGLSYQDILLVRPVPKLLK